MSWQVIAGGFLWYGGALALLVYAVRHGDRCDTCGARIGRAAKDEFVAECRACSPEHGFE